MKTFEILNSIPIHKYFPKKLKDNSKEVVMKLGNYVTSHNHVYKLLFEYSLVYEDELVFEPTIIQISVLMNYPAKTPIDVNFDVTTQLKR